MTAGAALQAKALHAAMLILCIGVFSWAASTARGFPSVPVMMLPIQVTHCCMALPLNRHGNIAFSSRLAMAMRTPEGAQSSATAAAIPPF